MNTFANSTQFRAFFSFRVLAFIEGRQEMKQGEKMEWEWEQYMTP